MKINIENISVLKPGQRRELSSVLGFLIEADARTLKEIHHLINQEPTFVAVCGHGNCTVQLKDGPDQTTVFATIAF
jgi:hypothetical protein